MILIACTLDSFRSLKDKSVKLTFETQETTPEQMAEIAKSSQSFGYLAFSPKMLSNEQLEAIDNAKTDLYDSSKTPSKRLRNTLYVLWEQNNNGYDKFEDFYLKTMEKIITHYKDKLI